MNTRIFYKKRASIAILANRVGWFLISLILISLVVSQCTQKKQMEEDSHKEVPPIVTQKVLEDLSLSDCRLTQSSEEHMADDRGHVYAVDIACVKGEEFPVYFPDHKPVYLIEKTGYDKLIGEYVILRHGNIHYVLGHTKLMQENWKVGELVTATAMQLGTTFLSGSATNTHLHYEVWVDNINVQPGYTVGEDYKQNLKYSQKLLEQRGWKFEFPIPPAPPKKEIYYFTHYDLGDVKQNDNAPCIGSSWVDLCYLERNGVHTMALTADIRKQMGIKFGDKVKLTGDAGCAGTYEVHDEMNKRFRESCIKRPRTNYCIKWDVSNRPGGACSVTKIQY